MESRVEMSRLQANEQIIHHITNYMRTYPDQRFGQILTNLGISTHLLEGIMEATCPVSDEHPRGIKTDPLYRDIFFEESTQTLKRLTNG